MSDWIIRIVYITILVMGIDLYGHPERYERFWGRFSPKRAHTISRLVGVLLILVSILFVLGADVFLPG